MVASIVEEIAQTTDPAARLTLLDGRRNRLVEPEREAIRGIWDDEIKLFAKYKLTIRCTGWLMGGTPKDPDVIAAWMRHKAGVTDVEELLEATRESLRQQGVDVPANATFEQLREASQAIAAERKGCGFVGGARGLVFETRKFKAGLKSSTAILYPWNAGHRAGWTRKAPDSYLAERVFVEEEAVPLGRTEPDYVHLQIGQVSGPQGKRSTLTEYEAVSQPTLTFTLFSTEDCVSQEQWKHILVHLQQDGIGAVRSQSFGKFAVVGWEKLADAAPVPAWVPPTKPGEEEKPKRVRSKRATDVITPGVDDKHPAGPHGVGQGRQ